MRVWGKPMLKAFSSTLTKFLQYQINDTWGFKIFNRYESTNYLNNTDRQFSKYLHIYTLFSIIHLYCCLSRLMNVQQKNSGIRRRHWQYYIIGTFYPQKFCLLISVSPWVACGQKFEIEKYYYIIIHGDLKVIVQMGSFHIYLYVNLPFLELINSIVPFLSKLVNKYKFNQFTESI